MAIITSKIEIIKGDITKVRADAIVNAANTSLLGGGGVDGAIHLAGGPAILDACRKIVAQQGGCKVGAAVITTAGKLPADFVIHTVGPIWRGGINGESEKLSNCYAGAMAIAEQHHCKSVAFSSISTGVYGYPKNDAAIIAVNTVIEKLKNSKFIEKVIFVCFDDENYNAIATAIKDKD